MFKMNLKKISSFIFIGLLAFSCDEAEDSTSPDGHTDAEGFILEDENGNELYREFEGAIVTSNITLSVGGELELSVHFLDHDGNEIAHEEEEEEEHEDSLSITEYNASIATIEVEGHEDEEEHCEDITTESECGTHAECEWHADDMACEDASDDHDHDHDHEEEHHGLAIHIVGVSAGSTSFKLELMHEGHADYTSTNNVSVTVTE